MRENFKEISRPRSKKIVPRKESKQEKEDVFVGEKKRVDDIQDVYLFRMDKLLTEKQQKEFPYLFLFKKFLNEVPPLEKIVVNYRKPGKNPTKNMQFTNKFIEYIEKKIPKVNIRKKVIELLQRSNENGDLYRYMRFRSKDKEYSQKQKAQACFTSPDSLHLNLDKIQVDDLLYGKLKKNFSSDVIDLWNEFISKHPTSPHKKNRLMEFGKYLEENHLFRDSRRGYGFYRKLKTAASEMKPVEIDKLILFRKQKFKENQFQIGETLHANNTFVSRRWTKISGEIDVLVLEKDFQNLQAILNLLEQYKNRTGVDLPKQFKEKQHYKVIFHRDQIGNTFLDFVRKTTIETTGNKNPKIAEVISWIQTQSKIENNKKKIELVLDKKITQIFDKPEIENYGKLKIIDAKLMQSMVKRVAGDDGVKIVENYIKFIQQVKSSQNLQQMWFEFKKKKRPYPEKFSEFKDFLRSEYLELKTKRDTTIETLIQEINSRDEVCKYMIFLNQRGLSVSEIIDKMHCSKDYVKNTLSKRPPQPVEEKEVKHIVKFLELVKSSDYKDYKSDGKRKISYPYMNNKISKSFREFLVEKEENKQISFGIAQEVEELLNILENVEKNDEIRHLQDILVAKENSRVYLKTLSTIFLSSEDSLRRRFKKDLGEEKYGKRFEDMVVLNERIHQQIEYLLSKVFIEHGNLGKVYHEVMLFKTENEFRPDSVILASEVLKQNLAKKFGIDKIDYILIDYTSNFDEHGILEKIAKYQPRENGMLLIVGTDWIFSDDQIDLPRTDLFQIKHPDQVKIMNVDVLAELLDIEKDQKNQNYDLFKKIEAAVVPDQLEGVKKSLKKYKEYTKSTDDFMIENKINDQTMYERYANFDPDTIYDVLIELRESKNYKPVILKILEEKGPLSKKEIRKEMGFEMKILGFTLKSMAKKNLIKYDLIRDDKGKTRNLYWLPSQERPYDPYDAKADLIEELFTTGWSVTKIMEIVGVSQKFIKKVRRERNLDERPNVNRYKADYCYRSIREKWDKRFLMRILKSSEFNNLERIVAIKKDGRSYFDKNIPLAQKDIIIKGKPLHPYSILYSIRNADKRLKSVYFNLAKLLKKNEGKEINLKQICRRYHQSNLEIFNENYNLEEFCKDFEKYILKDVQNNLNLYFSSLKNEELFKY